MSGSTETKEKVKHSLPSALDLLNGYTLTTENEIALFLDYDGTLTSIVSDPEKAFLSNEVRATLKELASYIPVFVISGRDRADVKEKVGLEELVYAGSHGYDISGPNLEMQYQGGVDCLESLDQAEMQLKKDLSMELGVKIERKKFAIAVHYRHVPEENVETVLEKVNAVIESHNCLKAGPGKMIMELKPDFEWHKGKALEWLLQTLKLNKAVPLFIGDDITDEDGFNAIAEKGIGILVADHGGKTSAKYSLTNTAQVAIFLELLLKKLKKKSV